MTIKELQVYCHKVAVEHGWWDEIGDGISIGGLFDINGDRVELKRSPLEVAALLHSEISEFVEDIRHGHSPNVTDFAYSDKNKPIGPAIELADLAIRLLDCCEAWGIDLEEMIKIKMKYNETRPYRHGNKLA